MARITCEAPVKYIQGKISKSDNAVFRVQHGVCRLYRQLRYTDPANGTASQKAAVEAFRATQAAVQSIMTDPTELASYRAQFAAQRKYKTLRSFIFASLYPGA